VVKNKRLLYVLLPAVILIWGLIFQRIWMATRTGEDAQGTAFVAPSLAEQRLAPLSVPPLLLTYADPFSGQGQDPELRQRTVVTTTTLSPKRESALTLNLPVAVPTEPISPVVWPQVRYLGSISNAGANNRIALLSINQHEVMVKVGRVEQQIKVTKIFRDSVEVFFQGQRKTFGRSVGL